MRRCMILLAVLLGTALLAACGGETTGPTTRLPLALAIVSGQNQTTIAGHDSLDAPVVSQLVQTASGRLVFRTVGNLSAQTVVNGSPVPGAVVCAVSVGPQPALRPFVPCTNTDADGKATFWFTPDTIAGVARAEIRGTVNDQPAVFDTAVATITPGPAHQIKMKPYYISGDNTGPKAGGIAVTLGDSLDVVSWIDTVTDAYGNVVTDYSSAQVAVTPYGVGGELAWRPGRFVTFPDTGWYRVIVQIDSAFGDATAHVQQ